MDHHNTPYCQEAGSLCYGHFIMHCYIYSSPVKHTLEIVASHKQKVHHVKQAQINSRNYDPEISLTILALDMLYFTLHCKRLSLY